MDCGAEKLDAALPINKLDDEQARPDLERMALQQQSASFGRQFQLLRRLPLQLLI